MTKKKDAETNILVENEEVGISRLFDAVECNSKLEDDHENEDFVELQMI